MSKNTSILLGSHFETFVNEKVTSGRYNSASEVIRTALRLLEQEEEGLKNLQKELRAGERSGMVSDFNPKKHLSDLHKKYI